MVNGWRRRKRIKFWVSKVVRDCYVFHHAYTIMFYYYFRYHSVGNEDKVGGKKYLAPVDSIPCSALQMTLAQGYYFPPPRVWVGFEVTGLPADYSKSDALCIRIYNYNEAWKNSTKGRRTIKHRIRKNR